MARIGKSAGAVLVRKEAQQAREGAADAQLFAQLAHEPAVGSFAGLEEAARQVPRSRVGRSPPAGEQDAPRASDEGHGGGHRIVVERPAATRTALSAAALLGHRLQPRSACQAVTSPRAHAADLHRRMLKKRSSRARRHPTAAREAVPRWECGAMSGPPQTTVRRVRLAPRVRPAWQPRRSDSMMGLFQHPVRLRQMMARTAGRRRAPRAGSRGKVVLWALLAVGLVLAAHYFDAPARLRVALDGIARLGPWGPALFALLYVAATVFFLPGSILTVGAGVVFGLVRGFVIVSISATLGASCGLSRGALSRARLDRGKIEGHPKFKAIDGRSPARAGRSWRSCACRPSCRSMS